MEYGKYQEAIARLGEALQTAPEAAGLYLLRAFCWAQLEKTSGRSRRYETEQDLGKVLELEPDNVMALRARCPTTATSARYPRHIQDLTLLMEADPENRDVYQISRAYRHYWTKNSAAAPEPFPVPSRAARGEPGSWAAISGSKKRSTSTPPRRYPTGMVKNCRVFRAA